MNLFTFGATVGARQRRNRFVVPHGFLSPLPRPLGSTVNEEGEATGKPGPGYRPKLGSIFNEEGEATGKPGPGYRPKRRPVASPLLLLAVVVLALAACAPGAAQPQPQPQPTPGAPTGLPAPVVEQIAGPTPAPATQTAVAAPADPATPQPQATEPAASPEPSPTPSPSPSPTPAGPQEINGVPLSEIVVFTPETAANVRAIYAKGQELGRDPRAFSKLGDSTILNPHFLGPFDQGDYDLGEFAHLQPVIDQFAGSFERHGVATHFGLHSWTVFDPLWADKDWCEPNETPLACEFRLQNPSVLFVRLGSNDAGSPSGFRFNVKEVIEFSVENGVIPIIGTKADRFEGSNENNDILRALADEYDVPLWDFDRLAETIPGRGLDTDGVHLVIDELPHDYTQEGTFQRGHAMQDLSALLALEAVWRAAEP